MKSVALKMKYVLALFIGGILAAGAVMADKPSRGGAGKGGQDERIDRRDAQRDEQRNGGGRDEHRQSGGGGDRHSDDKRGHFDERHRIAVHEYYVEQSRGGRCPPGLAKKHNGCMPPGQAKKWQIGRPLPREVIYYEVPRQLAVQIGPAPSGYRYVRVAGDILMMAIGTGMIVDAIQDMNR